MTQLHYKGEAMTRTYKLATSLLLASTLLAACASASPAPASQPSLTPRPTATKTITPTSTPSPTATPIPVPFSEAAEAAAVVEIARYGYGSLISQDYSADRSLIGVATTAGVFILGSQSHTEISYLPAPSQVTTFAFAPDSRTVAFGTEAGLVLVYDIYGKVLGQWEAHKGYVTSVAFSPDGAMLATTGEDDKLNIWSTADWSLAKSSFISDLAKLQFLPDGSTLVSHDYRRLILINTVSWQIANTIDRFPYQGRTIFPNIMDFDVSRDGKHIAFGSTREAYVGVWNTETRSTEFVVQIDPHDDPSTFAVAMYSVSLSAAGDKIAFAGLDRSGVVDAKTGEILAYVAKGGHSLVFVPNEDKVLMGLDFMDLSWAITSTLELGSVGNLPIELQQASSTSRDGKWEVQVDDDAGIVTLVDLRSGSEVYSIRAHTPILAPLGGFYYSVRHTQFSEDGSYFITIGDDLKVNLWATQPEAQPIPLGRISKGATDAAAFSADNSMFAFGGADGQVSVVTVAEGKATTLHRFTAPGRVSSLAFSRDSKTLAIGDSDGNILLYRISDGTLAQALGARGDVFWLQFTEDDVLLYSLGRDLIFSWGAE
jgi:WD40 repeat protein